MVSKSNAVTENVCFPVITSKTSWWCPSDGSVCCFYFHTIFPQENRKT